MKTILPLNSDDFKEAFQIECAAHRYPNSQSLFNSNQGGLYYNLKLTINGKMVGFLISHVVYDEATLFNIAVHPHYQRQGLGSQLFNFWLEDSAKKGVTKWLLEVRESNHSAIKLYVVNGFQPIDTRKNYYPCHNDTFENALIMLKELTICP